MGAAMTLEVLAAERGDSLLLTCERSGDRPWRLLVDGGMPGTWPALRDRLLALPEDDRSVDLCVVSHIDSDHIGGVLPLFDAGAPDIRFGDVWFNAFDHLPEPETGRTRSVGEGERLGRLLGGDGGRPVPWNRAFGGGTVMTPGDATFREVELPGAPRLTLLSPTPKRLAALRRTWLAELARLQRGEPAAVDIEPPGRAVPADLQALAATHTTTDASPANGSSIALLVEHEAHTCLLAADAFPTVLGAALTAAINDRGGETLPLDVFKLSHHGSKANVTGQLLEITPARHYVISTNGDRFHHPDDVAMARVVTGAPQGATLWFNYPTPAARRWAEAAKPYGHEAVVPPDEAAGVRIALG